MVTTLSQCRLCVNYWPDDSYNGAACCAAFPRGIPTVVLMNAVPHNKPLADIGQDNDYVFTPRSASGVEDIVGPQEPAEGGS